jgi:transcriptional regulator with XRE-family HTH domain
MTKRNDPLPGFVATPAELGAAVRAARTSMGLSIEQAAQRADVTPRMQMDVENGRGDVYLGDALRVASLCGLELLAQRRGTNALAKILAGDAGVEMDAIAPAKTGKATTPKA